MNRRHLRSAFTIGLAISASILNGTSLGEIPDSDFVVTSFKEVITFPERFDGQRIFIDGVILFGSENGDDIIEGPAILVRDEYFEKRIDVWIPDEWMDQYRVFSGKEVKIIGLYRAFSNPEKVVLMSIDPDYMQITDRAK